MVRKPTQIVTSKDIQEFAYDFRCVCEGHPPENYPVLLRELILQRCRVVATGQRSLVMSAQAICREVCIVMFAFQTPMVGVLAGEDIFDDIHNVVMKEKLLEAIGGEENIPLTRLCVFNDLFYESGPVTWSYVDTFTNAEILLMGLSDASEIVAMLMALTFSDCGRVPNTVVYKGRKKDAKLRILFSPPLEPADDPDRWLYNTDDLTHYWVGGITKHKQEMFLDGACFEYQPDRTAVYMWTHDDANYEVEKSEMCSREMAATILDRLKQMMGRVQFEMMENWDA